MSQAPSLSRTTSSDLPHTEELDREVQAVLDQVRRDGDRAVRDLTMRFDGVAPEPSRVDPKEIERALDQAPAALVEALRASAANLTRVGLAQRFSEEVVDVRPGVRVWRIWRPLQRVGVYVPGGRAPYPSSVLMLCVPARLAGCAEVVICSPPGKDGLPAQNILVAAAVAGVTEIHAVGGAQAVAAMAYGTETISRVDKVFGPGNAHVTAAKRLVSGDVAVDMPAGPSEVIVVSDGSVPSGWLVADLEAQAEHAPDALGILVSTDPAQAEEIARLVDPKYATQIRVRSVASMEAALEVANAFGPEHLILACRDAESWLGSVTHAGSVFLGSHSPAAAGDYATGANHVIPTGGAVRAYSPLGLEAFGRTLQVQAISPQGLARLAPVVEPLARAEGFLAHLRSVQTRLDTTAAAERHFPQPRRNVAAMHPYHWEASDAEVAKRAGISEGEVLRFDTNTCPWVGATLADLDQQELNEYPDSNYPGLVSAVAEYASCPRDTITVGAGADELLQLLALAFIGPGDPAVIPSPSYAMYLTLTEAAGGLPVMAPVSEPDGVMRSARQARVTWLCNPNNPTGELLPTGFVDELARQSAGLVVVDEAYFEFSQSTCVPLVRELGNLVVVRTLSKAFGLAGARVGYAISGPEVAATLARVRPPASLSTTSAALGTRALKDAPTMRARVQALLQDRQSLAGAIRAMGFTVYPSSTNFLLVSCPLGLADFLESKGLVVRRFPQGHALRGWMRVTVRSGRENARLLERLAAWDGPRAS